MKKIHCLKIILAVLIVTAVSCKKAEEVPGEPAKAAFDLAAAKTAVESGYKDFENAFNTKDAEALANCYANDAKFMPPNEKPIEGKVNIQKAFGQWFQGDMPKIKLSLVEFWGNENNVIAENAWTMTGADGKVVDEGKSIEVYKMEDGKWKMIRDCYNSNMPVMPVTK